MSEFIEFAKGLSATGVLMLLVYFIVNNKLRTDSSVQELLKAKDDLIAFYKAEKESAEQQAEKSRAALEANNSVLARFAEALNKLQSTLDTFIAQGRRR